MWSNSYEMALDDNALKNWRAVGQAESLAADLDIARFLVAFYNRNKGKENRNHEMKCSQCLSPLAFLCTGCNMSHLPSPLPRQTTAQAVPVQVEAFPGDGSLETLVLSKNLSSQEPTVVQSHTQLLQGESPSIEALSAVKRTIERLEFKPELSDHSYYHFQFPPSLGRFRELEAEKKNTGRNAVQDEIKPFTGNDTGVVNNGGERKTQSEIECVFEDISEPEDEDAFAGKRNGENGSQSQDGPVRSESGITICCERRPVIYENVDSESKACSTVLQGTGSDDGQAGKRELPSDGERENVVRLPSENGITIINEGHRVIHANDENESQVCSTVLSTSGSAGQVKKQNSSLEGVKIQEGIRTTEAKLWPKKQVSRPMSAVDGAAEPKGLQIPNEIRNDKELVASLTKCDVPMVKTRSSVLKGSDNVCGKGQTNQRVCPENTYGVSLNAGSKTAQCETEGEVNFKQEVQSVDDCGVKHEEIELPCRLDYAVSTDEQMYKCANCSEVFTQRNGFTHPLWTHRQKAPNSLDDAKSIDSSASEAKITLPEEGSFVCSECQSTYPTRSPLLSPCKKTHPKSEGLFECNLCYQKFNLERSVVRHMKREHPQDACLQCKACDFQCRTSKDMKNHKKKVHYKHIKRQCELCGIYMTSQAMRAHVLLHRNEKPYACEHCGKKCRSMSQLGTHMKGYHNGLDRPYRCDQCGKSFIKHQSLKDHMYSHTGEKPFQCPHCPSKFVRKDYLSKHLVRHSGDRPFECDICRHRFAFSCSMNKHKRTVHGKKNRSQQTSDTGDEDAKMLDIPDDSGDYFENTASMVPVYSTFESISGMQYFNVY